MCCCCFLVHFANTPEPEGVEEGHTDDVFEHLQAGRHHRQMRPIDFLPVHAHFADGDAQFLGQEEQLHIKRPALNVQVEEQPLRCRSREKFEATLRVLDAPHAQSVHQHVEAHLRDVPVPGPLCLCACLLCIWTK